MSSATEQKYSLSESVDKLGKSLREDYNEEIRDATKPFDLQDELNAQLRVQIDQGLRLVPAPYLPAKVDTGYTLVLDLDETLLHFEEVSKPIIHFKLFIDQRGRRLAFNPTRRRPILEKHGAFL